MNFRIGSKRPICPACLTDRRSSSVSQFSHADRLTTTRCDSVVKNPTRMTCRGVATKHKNKAWVTTTEHLPSRHEGKYVLLIPQPNKTLMSGKLSNDTSAGRTALGFSVLAGLYRLRDSVPSIHLIPNTSLRYSVTLPRLCGGWLCHRCGQNFSIQPNSI